MVIDGPFAQWTAAMTERLRELGYAAGSTSNQLAVVAKLRVFLERRGLSANDLTPVVLERFCASLAQSGCSSPTPRAFAWLVEFLRDVGERPAIADEPRSQADEMMERYRRFLLGERGLLPDTVTNYVRALTPFLAEHSDRALKELSAGDVSRFMTRQVRRLSPRGLERLATSLRSVFGFAWRKGLSRHRWEMPSRQLRAGAWPAFLGGSLQQRSMLCWRAVIGPPRWGGGTTPSWLCWFGSVCEPPRSRACALAISTGVLARSLCEASDTPRSDCRCRPTSGRRSLPI